MSTKFFNNGLGNTLFDKLKGIASEMTTFDRFLAVVGFFRSSGYFKLRKELGDISEIKILVGINIDDIFRKHNKALLMLADEDKAKEIYHNGFKEDIINAQYSPEVEEGILQMREDVDTYEEAVRKQAALAEQARLKEQAAKEQESKAKSIKDKQQPKDNPQ